MEKTKGTNEHGAFGKKTLLATLFSKKECACKKLGVEELRNGSSIQRPLRKLHPKFQLISTHIEVKVLAHGNVDNLEEVSISVRTDLLFNLGKEFFN